MKTKNAVTDKNVQLFNIKKFENISAGLLNPFKLKLFFLTKLPLALIAGLRIKSITDQKCEVTVPYGWKTSNPFKSTYFAAQSMAAELSTGALVIAAIKSTPGSIAMLITGLNADFIKKATSLTVFTCSDGEKIIDAVNKAAATGKAVTFDASTTGKMPDGTVVSKFTFTWSVRKRNKIKT